MGASLWIVWTVIGIIGGFMVGRLIPHIRSTALAVCVGICGALLGGFLFIVLLGTGSIDMEVLSLASSAVICALFLWVLSLATRRRHKDDVDDDE
ncbi:GlsB/YeaQ/YmgE family stress response membrane protein [uncultured Muribaculum sp.]|uniref:GlsB/YeaQ/YmgE family stress response membrane protein n=1 Tax=uncultured Muribaculum sp. TaxID=1918613 RepID=UPI002638956A|nr:GlsB/YeaQ/YmgE family stress response membrane protein [uncultured Muribaculum sp.]